MRKCAFLFVAFFLGATGVLAQEESAPDSLGWQFNSDVNFYFIPDDFFILPVFRVDKNKLHLEARYNYEDRETFSVWAGYNFTGGNKLEYTLTPMVGGVAGRSNGMAPGFEFNLTFRNFELYSESEYFFDFESSENHFLYIFTELTYSPKEWLWFGVSGQRTRVYQTDLEIQRGILVGGGLKQWELTTYLFNLGFDDPFIMATLSVTF